jgi:hypothetical protein
MEHEPSVRTAQALAPTRSELALNASVRIGASDRIRNTPHFLTGRQAPQGPSRQAILQAEIFAGTRKKPVEVLAEEMRYEPLWTRCGR